MTSVMYAPIKIFSNQNYYEFKIQNDLEILWDHYKFNSDTMLVAKPVRIQNVLH